MTLRDLHLLLCAVFVFSAMSFLNGQTRATAPNTGTVEGRVTDPTGAVIAGAAITLFSADTPVQQTTTDRQGQYSIGKLLPGSYTLHVQSSGFATFESDKFDIAGAVQHLDVKLAVAKDTENVTVSATNQIGVDPTQNAGQLLLRGSDLDALSDDSEDLANDLQMLAGPAAGPDGPQIYIDGFTDGIMPPKQSIREIRINQNPFSAEFDRVGFGRVEVFTKPGADQYHVQGMFNFGNRALTARNPYLLGPIVPDYQQEIFSGSFSGPLSKKASFFLDGQGRITDENSVLNYTQLDAAFNPQQISTALIAPSRRYSFSPRLDYALTPSQTLVIRYSLAGITARNQGLSPQNFDEASQAYANSEIDQNVQISESAVIGASLLNNARFQFYGTHLTQKGNSSAPQVTVQGAFTSGGSFPLNFTDRDRYEFQNYTTFLHGSHTLDFGIRWRGDWLREQSTTNFNGQFIFSGGSAGQSALAIYQQNQTLAAQGVPQDKIAALGFGPSQFLLTSGQPFIGVNQNDVSLFLQDDWRVRPNFTFSAGLRYEVQNQISDHTNFAPRAAIAWAPDGRTKAAKTVLRAASGIFYDRFTSDLIWNATRQDGIHQVQYLIRNPTFFPNVPDPATLAELSQQQSDGSSQAVYRIEPRLRVPRLLQSAVSLERSLPHDVSLSLTYTNTRGWHQLRTVDINAPFPAFVDSNGIADGPRPYGDASGDIYEYNAGGVFRQNQLILSARAKVNRNLSVFGYYVYSKAMSDTDGPNTFPSNPYDLRAEYGRAGFDFRHRAFISGTATLPLRIRLASFLFLQSGMPYNVISGIDTNNDGNPNDDRPAFAQNGSRPSVVVKPGFGAFDTSPLTLPGAMIVPRNWLQGPGILSLTARVSRTWSFGKESRHEGTSGGDQIRGGDSIRNGGLGGGSNQSGMASVYGGTATRRPYNLTFDASFRNALNNVNPATPIGNLSSPYFGTSISLNTFGPLPGAGPNAGAGNRHIELQVRFSF